MNTSRIQRLIVLFAASCFLVGVVPAVGAVQAFMRPGRASLKETILLPLLALICAAIGGFLAARRKTVNMKRSLFIAVVWIFAFTLGELTLAAIGYEPNRRLALWIPPLAPWFSCDTDIGCVYRKPDDPSFNAQGFRDREPFTAQTVNNDALRILVLGDSFSFGVGADKPEDAYPQVLERDLRKRMSKPVQLWNTGIPGTGQKQQLLVAAKFLPMMRPDRVVLGFCYNDFADNLVPVGKFYVFAGNEWVQRYVIENGRVRELTPKQAYRRALAPHRAIEYLYCSRMITAAYRLYARINADCRKESIGNDRASEYQKALTGEPTDEYLNTRDLMAELRDKVAVSGAEFVVLPIPEREDFRFGPGKTAGMTKRLCDELNLQCLDNTWLTAADYENRSGHWNDAGHRKAGEFLAGYLLSQH